MFVRSDISWISTTGRKPKARPRRAYTHQPAVCTKEKDMTSISSEPDELQGIPPKISAKVNVYNTLSFTTDL